ncbi:thiamine biosynthesis protein ThiS [Saccharobesus litoralis]|uniref:Thiamine biosynthesis protein ThiS n=1 Tax=Saccharobesus litoralis TaxID=2172099 RepID=A0A2S0VMA1_9ALTE|nr:sulfur carrier protein ThiS [Saccharobesus litoralis]AWB65344.1 thiamine biosynthesis protein ThiS [Saccharobesus litoralis]
MKLIINSQEFETPTAQLAATLQAFGATPPFAVAVNGDFVAQQDYESTELNPGDCIDIVSPIYGG